MQRFLGHAIPGFYFFVVGLWHLYNSYKNYLDKSKPFELRVWHPAPLPGQWKYIELFFGIFGALFDAIVVEIGFKTHFQPFADGGIAPGKVGEFEHASMLFGFAVLLTAVYISESTSWLPLPQGATNLCAGVAFLGEAILFGFHSKSMMGVEGRYHRLLLIIILACVLISVIGAQFPNSFLVDAAGSATIMFQGFWFIWAGICYNKPFIARGCTTPPPDNEIICETEMDTHRAMALANLQYTFFLSGHVIFCLAMYAVMNARAVRAKNRALELEIQSAGSQIEIEEDAEERSLLAASQ